MARFSILTVCSGNVCRSPVAEQVLRSRFADIDAIELESSGFVALVGDGMPQQAQQLAASLGATPTPHTARQLTEQQILEAGLVLAMSREHRREIVTLVPKASRYTVTIREFARLSAGLDAWDLLDITALPEDQVTKRLGALVELIASRRGQVDPPESPEDDDIVDPYKQSDERYALTGAQLGPALDEVHRMIRLALAPRGAVA